MWNRLRRWLNDIPAKTPIERQQASMMQSTLIGLIIISVLALLLNLITPPLIEGNGENYKLIVGPTSTALLGVCATLSLWLLRRGRFEQAVLLTTTGFILVVALNLVGAGVQKSGMLLTAFTVPIAVAGLLLSRRGLVWICMLTVVIVAAIAIVEYYKGPAGFAPLANEPVGLVGNFALLIALFAVLLDRFSSSLRDTLEAALSRERELNRLRKSLETTVEERTASLQDALRVVEQREAHLAQTVNELRTSQELIQELSAPVIPVLPGVLVAPLIGVLDTKRAAALAENVLTTVERMRALHVIFDITGVPIVDTHVAKVLLQATTAVRLLGAQVLLVGVRPEVAQTIVTLGIDLGMIETYPNLQEAVMSLMAQRIDSAPGAL